jgi:hypothetical protein
VLFLKRLRFCMAALLLPRGFGPKHNWSLGYRHPRMNAAGNAKNSAPKSKIALALYFDTRAKLFRGSSAIPVSDRDRGALQYVAKGQIRTAPNCAWEQNGPEPFLKIHEADRMSVEGQKRRFSDAHVTSALTPKTDIHRKGRHV